MTEQQPTPVATPCLECLRRSWLVAQLSEHLLRFRFASRRLAEILALDDLAMIAEVAETQEVELHDRHASFDPAWLPAIEGVERICRHDPRYPAALHVAPDAPAVLSVAGAVALDEALCRSNVVIIGSRRPSHDSKLAAHALAKRLADASVTVISGSATGVNDLVLAGTLQAGGITISVMPCGVDVAYPQRQPVLREQLLAGGLLVSEFPAGSRVRPWCFAARNRVLAGLSTTLIVVDAAGRDVNLSIVDAAEKLGRPVAAVAGGNELGEDNEGVLRLLRHGAIALEHVDDVVGLITSGAIAPRPPEPAPAPTSTLAPTPTPAPAPAPVRFGLQLPEPAANPAVAPPAMPAAPVEHAAAAAPAPVPVPISASAPVAEAPTPTATPAPFIADGGLEPELQSLLHAVRAGRDDVAALTADGKDVDLTLTGLAMLELLGHLRRTPEGRYRPVAGTAVSSFTRPR